ncbi:MAG: hypothetical protein OHK0056_33350 [Bacteriovoracaceae bacterium]
MNHEIKIGWLIAEDIDFRGGRDEELEAILKENPDCIKHRSGLSKKSVYM